MNSPHFFFLCVTFTPLSPTKHYMRKTNPGAIFGRSGESGFGIKEM